MFKVGDKIKTRCGSPSEPYWEYGTITATKITEDGDTLYKVSWDDNSYDYLYDFEMETVERETENQIYYETPPKTMEESIMEAMRKKNDDVIDFNDYD